MPSVITWLDVSSDEQRRMRELAAMFTERNSRDELGIGQIRDGISDALFPGTSTLHTRARYLLLVPWSFQHAARAKSPGKNGKPQPDATELALIDPLRASSDSDGLLGERAGMHLQNLPSSVYWTMLQRYGILNRPASRADALAASAPRMRESDDGSLTASSIWSVPAAPAGFPSEIPDGFALTADEAAWLRDRVFEHAPGTLLAHLMLHRPQSDSATPWADPACVFAPERAATVLVHAHQFSAIMHGSQLLYNLLLARESERPELQDEYRSRLTRWAAELPSGYENWRLDALLQTIHRERGSHLRVAAGALRFVRDWSALVQRLDPATIIDAPDAQSLIRMREKIKGAKARLGNPKRLQAWTGASGSGRLTFRWATVRRFATDIHEGLDRA